jgi:hypothetical protein
MEPLDEGEITFLKGMMREPDMVCGNPPWAGWILDLYYNIDKLTEEDDYVIADVHTQPTDEDGNMIGKILHVGTGKVNLGLFLAGSPSDHYKPVAFIGPCMSYYEHPTLNFDRMTDERWSDMIQGGFPPRPGWTNVYLANREGHANQGGLRLRGEVFQEKDPAGKADIGTIYTQIYPNPVSDLAVINFYLKENAPVRLELYNATGRKIAVTDRGLLTAGKHWIEWPVADLSPGIHFMVLRAGRSTSTLKFILQ